MNTAEPQQTDGQSKGGNCNACTLEEIEQLTCDAKRFGQQAKVMDEVAANLETYRDQYTAARQAYTDARDAVALDLDAIQTTLSELWDQLRCPATDDQKECMTEASAKVFEDIAKCSDPPGCHSPCDDSAGPDPESQTDVAALAAEIARRRSNLAESAAYFTSLIAEPVTIKQQMATRKADATVLAKDVTTGGDGSKVASLYARWLILSYWANLSRTGRGFGSVTDYLDCLCGVLKCLVSGWTIVAILEGRKAQLQCYEDARQKACEKEKDDTLHAILDLYEACCRKNESESPSGPAESA